MVLVRQGKAVKEVAEEVGMASSSVYRYLRMDKAPKPCSRKKRVATPRLISKIKWLAHGVKNMLTRKVQKMLAEKHVIVSQSTVYRVLKVYGFQKKKSKKTFRVTNANRLKRVKFAQKMLSQDHSNLVFLDETSIVATSKPNPHNDGIWLLPEEEAEMTPQDKHPLKINAISAISMRGKSRLHLYKENMNGDVFCKYLRMIVNEMRKGPYAGREFILVMDSASRESLPQGLGHRAWLLNKLIHRHTQFIILTHSPVDWFFILFLVFDDFFFGLPLLIDPLSLSHWDVLCIQLQNLSLHAELKWIRWVWNEWVRWCVDDHGKGGVYWWWWCRGMGGKNLWKQKVHKVGNKAGICFGSFVLWRGIWWFAHAWFFFFTAFVAILACILYFSPVLDDWFLFHRL